MATTDVTTTSVYRPVRDTEIRRTRKPYRALLVAAVITFLFSTWGTSVTSAQEHDGGDHDMDHGGGDGGGGDPSDPGVPPYGPPPAGRNPGEQRAEITYGPYNVPAPSGGEHHGHTGNRFAFGVQKPCDNCQLTSMTAKLVDASGQEIGNPENMQLHHMLLTNTDWNRSDATCEIGLPFPLGLMFGERFFASGDERTPTTMPPGYGYPVGSGSWNLIYELANGNDTPQDVFIEVVYDYVPGTTLRNVDPVWFDIAQCGFSTSNVPAGQHTRTWSWNVNRPGSIVTTGGHQHGNWVNGAVDGGTHIEMRLGDANGEVICDSEAGYDTSSFYEDGHGSVWLESMSKCGNEQQAESVADLNVGDQVTIVGHYDQQTAWPGQMGIMVAYVAPDGVDGAPPPSEGGDTGGGEEECSLLGQILGWCGTASWAP